MLIFEQPQWSGYFQYNERLFTVCHSHMQLIALGSMLDSVMWSNLEFARETKRAIS